MPSRRQSVPWAMTETDLQKSVIDLCKAYRLKWYHPYQPKYDEPGWPDMVIGGPRGVLFRELKDATYQPTPDQVAWGELLTAARHDWAIWRPPDWPARIRRELEAIR